MRLVLMAACGLALSGVGFARTVVFTGTGGVVDLFAADASGPGALMLAAPPGPVSFGIGGSVGTPASSTGMFGDATVSISALTMSMVGAIGGGSSVGGFVDGIASADIFFSLTTAMTGTFSAAFTLFDPNPLLSGTISLTGPNAASVALGTHVFDVGDYHLHAEVLFGSGFLAPDSSGHLDFGAMISFVPMPTGAGLSVAGLMAIGGVRRRR